MLLVFLLMGLFLKPGEADVKDPEWYKSLLESTNIVRAVIFMAAILTLLGWLIFIGYTAYGMVAWPVGMIKGNKDVNVAEFEVPSVVSLCSPANQKKKKKTIRCRTSSRRTASTSAPSRQST